MDITSTLRLSHLATGLKENGLKLKEGKFRSVVRKKILYSEGGKALALLPRKVMGASFLEAFKARLDGDLDTLIWWVATNLWHGAGSR